MVCLPVPLARRTGSALGSLGFFLFRKERCKILNNLALAYGDEMPEAERQALAKRIFRNVGRGVAALAYASSGREGTILSRCRVDGLEHVLEVLETGRGVLLLTAHVGLWELNSGILSAVLPCESGVVARELNNPHFERMILEMRRRLGVRVFSRGKTGRDYVRFLRKGNCLAIMGDIDTRKGDGIFVDFFGRPAWTQSGIARLARIGRARVVPCFLTPAPDDPDGHVLEILPPIPEPEEADEGEWIEAMTRAFTAEIERAVRKRPDQWMWMHRRWRHQPEDMERKPSGPTAKGNT